MNVTSYTLSHLPMSVASPFLIGKIKLGKGLNLFDHSLWRVQPAVDNRVGAQGWDLMFKSSLCNIRAISH